MLWFTSKCVGKTQRAHYLMPWPDLLQSVIVEAKLLFFFIFSFTPVALKVQNGQTELEVKQLRSGAQVKVTVQDRTVASRHRQVVETFPPRAFHRKESSRLATRPSRSRRRPRRCCSRRWIVAGSE